MKLADWIDANGRKAKWVAGQLGVTPQTLSMYCTGRRVPTPVVMRRIIRLTDAKVAPNDFYDMRSLAAERAADVVPSGEGAAA